MAETTSLRSSESGEGWRLKPRGRFLDQLAGFAAGGVLGWVALLALAGQHRVTLMVTLALLGWLIYRRRAGLESRERAPRLRKDALVLPPRTPTPAVVPVLGMLAVAFTGFTVLAVVQTLRGQVDVTLAGVVGVVLAGVVSVLLLVGAYAGVRAVAANRGLRLTPEALVVQTVRPPVVIAWDDLADVRTHWTRAGGAAVRNWLGFATSAGEPAPAVDMNLLATEPDLVLHVLTYYRDHPESRAELGTDAALERVASISRSGG